MASAKGAPGRGRVYRLLPDICVCCGEPVPEGRQVCWKCERQEGVEEDTGASHSKKAKPYGRETL